MDKRLIKKIENLLNLGNNNSFEGEATLAIDKAYALMKKYNISEEDVKNISREDVLGDMGMESPTEEPRQFRRWETVLLSNICKLFDCHLLRGRYYKRSKLYIVGREANRRTAIIMYNWIYDKTVKEARQVGKRYASARVSYCNGVADAIISKVNMIKSQETVKTDAWGIIPADEVRAWISNNFNTEHVTLTTGQLRDARSYAAGISAGKSISLNRQFGLKAIEGKI